MVHPRSEADKQWKWSRNGRKEVEETEWVYRLLCVQQWHLNMIFMYIVSIYLSIYPSVNLLVEVLKLASAPSCCITDIARGKKCKYTHLCLFDFSFKKLILCCFPQCCVKNHPHTLFSNPYHQNHIYRK